MLKSSFSRNLRLNNNNQYQAVYQERKRVVTPNLIFYIKPNTLSHPRLGLSIPKRYVRNAVDRNRIKRISKEFFRFRQQKLAGFDVVMVAKKGIENTALFECLGQQWDYFLNSFEKL